jgi:hypothetical protein
MPWFVRSSKREYLPINLTNRLMGAGDRSLLGPS